MILIWRLIVNVMKTDCFLRRGRRPTLLSSVFFTAAWIAFILLVFPSDNTAGENVIGAVERLSTADLPNFVDDHSPASLREAIGNSLRYYEKQPDTARFPLGNVSLSKDFLVETLLEFLRVIESVEDGADLNTTIRERFDVVRVPSSRETGNLLVTGYYEPEMEGRLIPEGFFQYPLYKVPEDLLALVSPMGKKRIRRLTEYGRLVPYWTREAIDTKGTVNGDELVYLSDPLDAFALHIQGSGKIQFPGGGIRRIGYAADNGHPYTSIGKRLVEQGKLPLEEATMPGIIAYLRGHPDERDTILHANKRYIFFRWLDGTKGELEAPLGSIGEELTAGRSVALDDRCYPPGGLGFLETRRPKSENDITGPWMPMTRFVLHQDSGGAIKGAGRLDFFWGGGRYAASAAGSMRHPGRLFFLIRKEGRLPR